jgi:hypothetical protein
MNLSSILDNYTHNYGRINLYINNHILYLDDSICKKDVFNLKLHINDLEHILIDIKKNNRYLIHIINTIHNPADVISYNKTLFIDNYGNIYSAYTSFFNYKEPSKYPMNTNLSIKKIEFPKEPCIYPLPDFMIKYIKNINNNFMFTIIDYTNPISDLITKLNEFSHYFYEFKQEVIINKQIIEDKNNLLINIIDNEINDFKLKHEAQLKSNTDIVKYLEQEHIVNQHTIHDLTLEIKQLKQIKVQNKQYHHINENLRIKLNLVEAENQKYKTSFSNRIFKFFSCFCCKRKVN